jgi:hypothetical protein
MRRNLSYKDLSAHEAVEMETNLYDEVSGLSYNHPIRLLLDDAIWDYKKGLWKYDGPTFVRTPRGFWEVAAFIHDWRNSMGYVSYSVDEEMFSIMIFLNYPIKYIIERWILTRFTFINIFIKYITRKLKIKKPTNLFVL